MQLDSKATSRTQEAPRNMNFDFGDRKTWMVEPPSERVSRFFTISGVVPELTLAVCT